MKVLGISLQTKVPSLNVYAKMSHTHGQDRSTILIYRYQIKEMYQKEWPQTIKKIETYKSIMANQCMWQQAEHTTH